MDVLVNNFDTGLCAASRRLDPQVRSKSARWALPLALGLPGAMWVAAFALWPVHSDAFVLTVLAVHALGGLFGVFCLSRAFVYGQAKLALGSVVAMAVAVLPVAMILTALRLAF